MDSVLVINNQVENLLPDNPTRQDIIARLDHIKSLDVFDRKLYAYIIDEENFRSFKDFYLTLNTDTLHDSNRTFYYEIPKLIYNWFTANSFTQIIDRIALFYGFVQSIYISIKDDLYNSPISKQINKAGSLIDNIPLEKKDLFRYRKLYKKLLLYKSQEVIFRTFKYWKCSEKQFNSLPIEPFLVDEFDFKSEWSGLYSDGFFKFKYYSAAKRYKNIQKNNLSYIPHNTDKSCTPKYVDIWKYFYLNPDIKKNEISNISCFAKKSKHTFKEDPILCNSCGRKISFDLFLCGQPKESEFYCFNC